MSRLVWVIIAAVLAAIAPAALGADHHPGRGAVIVHDHAYDVNAGDIDILSGSLRRSHGRLSARINVRQPVADNAIYCAVTSGSKAGYQLCAKRVAGHDTYFLYESYPNSHQVSAAGAMRRRTITLSIDARLINAARFRFYFSAETTNGRAVKSDRAPDDDRSVLEQLKSPDARDAAFPSRKESQ